MPSYKRYLVLVLVVLFTGCSNTQLALKNAKQEDTKQKAFKKANIKNYEYENEYIMYALEYENQKYYENAKELYSHLYEKTNSLEYLLKYVQLSFLLNQYSDIKTILKNKDIKAYKQEEALLKLEALTFYRLNEFDTAILMASRLSKSYPKSDNYELLGTFYLKIKDYKKAYKEFEKVHELNPNINSLTTLANIEFYYLDKKNIAVKKLKEAIKESYPLNASLQLVAYYEKLNQKDNAVNLLKDMYISYNERRFFVNLETTRRTILTVVKNEHVKKIDALLKQYRDYPTLISIYQKNSFKTEALELLKELYRKTSNNDYLAQIAILEFEIEKNKKNVLDSVLKKFEKVINSGIENAIYENYYAYLLIDYNIDIKKGLVLVNKALKKQPNNLAFIDTLAWGEYKVNNCKKAYKHMKYVVDKVGVDDAEIKLHWDKIKECK